MILFATLAVCEMNSFPASSVRIFPRLNTSGFLPWFGIGAGFSVSSLSSGLALKGIIGHSSEYTLVEAIRSDSSRHLCTGFHVFQLSN